MRLGLSHRLLDGSWKEVRWGWLASPSRLSELPASSEPYAQPKLPHHRQQHPRPTLHDIVITPSLLIQTPLLLSNSPSQLHRSDRGVGLATATMEPSNKKRRLAPKMAEKPNSEQVSRSNTMAMLAQTISILINLFPQVQYNYKPMPPVQDAAPPAERTDFESFARHLQDAAMLIYAQANRSPYTSVSVLLLRWEDDLSVEQDLLQLQKVFQDRFNYHTESWCIPSCPNPSIKLTMQMAQQKASR